MSPIRDPDFPREAALDGMWENYRELSQITGVVFHDSGFEPDMEGILSDHLRRRFDDIGYHLAIDQDGTFYQGRLLHFQGAHVGEHWEGLRRVGGYNPGTVGIVFFGHDRTNGITPQQVASALSALDALDFATGNRMAVATHADLVGRNWNPFLNQRPMELATSTSQMQWIFGDRARIERH